MGTRSGQPRWGGAWRPRHKGGTLRTRPVPPFFTNSTDYGPFAYLLAPFLFCVCRGAVQSIIYTYVSCAPGLRVGKSGRRSVGAVCVGAQCNPFGKRFPEDGPER